MKFFYLGQFSFFYPVRTEDEPVDPEQWCPVLGTTGAVLPRSPTVDGAVKLSHASVAAAVRISKIVTNDHVRLAGHTALRCAFANVELLHPDIVICR